MNVEFAGGESCPGRGCKGANIHTNSFSDYETIATKGYKRHMSFEFEVHFSIAHFSITYTIITTTAIFSFSGLSRFELLPAFSSFPCSNSEIQSYDLHSLVGSVDSLLQLNGCVEVVKNPGTDPRLRFELTYSYWNCHCPCWVLYSQELLDRI